MNILLLTQVLPYPLDAGPKVRAYYMLRHLAQRHAVTLVSFVRPDDRPEHVAHLRDIAAAVHTVPIRRSAAANAVAGVRGLLTGLPIAVVRDAMPAMAALLRRLTAETRFDVIHADQLSMAGWGLLAAKAAPSRPKTLLDEHNAVYKLAERIAAESAGLRRLIALREARAFRRYEAAMLRAYDAMLTVTEEDRALLETLEQEGIRGQRAEVSGQKSAGRERELEVGERRSRFTVIPICVDPERTPVAPRRPDGPPTILHLGTMFWPPNMAGVLWFGRQVLPRVWAQAPDARFVVVGKNPPPEVQALAADPRIEVTGYVADPQPYLEAADVFIVPLFSGSGMRVKILDAWLWGLPIVATPIGAEGIARRDGENILIAPDAAAFADAVVRLLTDADLNRRLRAAGRAWVEARYSWQAVYRRVDEVYARLLDRG